MKVAFNAIISVCIIVGIYYIVTGRLDAGMSVMAIVGLMPFVMDKNK